MAEAPAAAPRAAPGARYAVAVLTAMNLLNYVDRYVPSATKDLTKHDLGLTDAQTSLPLTAFVLVYMLASPVFGALADRASRRALIAGGVALWSLATAAGALAGGFWSFLFARALVGVGEAAYATISPALISDFYPPARRNRVLTVFYVAIPVGAALGFALGGALGQAYGWRAAFMVCGLPGLLAAALALRIRDPGRGHHDADAGTNAGAGASGWGAVLGQLARNRTYVVAVAGYVAVTFAGGGMADWFPAYLARTRGFTVAEAGGLIGTMTVLGGLLGTLAGGAVADKLAGRTRQPYLALSGWAMVPAALFAALALVVPGRAAIAGCVLLTQFFLWAYNGPINAVLVNATPAAIRARAFSVSILAIHLLGDALSPPAIGLISDRTGRLGPAMALIPAAIALGAAIWLAGWRRLPDPTPA